MSNPTAKVPESDVLLEARGVSKSFPGVKALDGARITVRRGKLNALLGENGAGKSTLMNVLAGVFSPDAGEIMLAGRSVRFRDPRDAQRAGVSVIFQELNLAPHLSVAENIFLGREPLTRLGLIDYARMNRAATLLLEPLRLDIDPRTPVSHLRISQRQVIEIAKALSFHSRVIIMDEPTSALTEREVDSLFRIIQGLKQDGVGIVFITHKLDELSWIADDVTVLRDGRFIDAKPYSSLTRDEVVRMMVGRDLAQTRPRGDAPSSEVLLRVEGLSLRHPNRREDYAVRDVSLEVRRGEIVGLFGLMGAGRTELLETLFGLHPRSSSGAISMAGKRVSIRSTQDAIQAGLALAPEDRKGEGLLLTMSVAENASLCCLGRTLRLGLIQPFLERRFVGGFVERLRIKTPSLDEPVRNLSGGNQQKVVLAKWLATAPKVLLLDEPTRGVDVRTKQDIHALIGELAREGLGVLMVSSELPEILAVADRIIVLAEGRKTGEFRRDEASEEGILKAALPAGKSTETVTA